MNQSGILDGIRVFDATQYMVGPWASMLLGFLGAEVLHIEHPEIDWSALSARVPPTVNGTSIAYIAWNMNKKGVGIDFKNEEDLAFAYRLIETCDVFVCNMRPQVVDRLGLGYEKLKEINPRLVYCYGSGFGRVGPRSKDPAVDNIIQSLTGSWAAQGKRDGIGELYRHYAQIDAVTGNILAQAALMGIYARKRTGKGQRIDVTMLDAAAHYQLPRLAEHFSGEVHQPRGSSAFSTAPDRAFCCEDGRWIGVSVRSDKDWEKICGVLPELQLASDSRFTSNVHRVENRIILEDILVRHFQTKPRDYWEFLLSKADVPWGSPMRWDELRYHSQVRDNNYIVEINTSVWGRLWSGGAPWRFSKADLEVIGPPIPGCDTYALKEEMEG